MAHIGLPDRDPTTCWRLAGDRLLALLDGVRWLVGLALLVDAGRSLLSPDASLLGVLVRWPGGGALPALLAVPLAVAFLVPHRISSCVLAAFGVLALVNVGEFYVLKARGLDAGPLPFSLVTLGLLAGAIAGHAVRGPARPWAWRIAGAAAAAPTLVLVHLLSFGATDYARPADAIVVFGAGVRGDRPTLALDDRVKHGIRLWKRGLAPVIVMSGGPDEVPVMERLALRAGVPASAIERDPKGLNTYATMENLSHRRVVAVSHYYHLARIKLTARRLGIRCATAPCPMTRRLVREPWYVTRECAAFAAYYLFRG